jgi:hypothetical protein
MTASARDIRVTDTFQASEMAYITSRSNIWFNWALIAVDHERRADTAIQEMLRVWDQPGARRNILDEMHPAMVAIVASALAVEGLHADLAPFVDRAADPRDAKHKGPSWGYYLDTFIAAAPEAEAWRAEMKWLFEERNEAAHFKAETQKLVPHVDLPTNVSPENVQFSRGTASPAVELVMKIFRALLGGQGEHGPVGAWGYPYRRVVDKLEEAREHPV